MSSLHRSIGSFCIFVPLLYTYWRTSLADGGTLKKLSSWDVTGKEDVSNDTLGFSKIVVINLPSRKDRRDAMSLAGSVSNLTFTWIDGVAGDQVSNRDVPPIRRGEHAASGAKGSWRSHMDALRSVTRENLPSALILEDDIDWDIRLKSQLQTFALASRTWLRESKSGRHRTDLPDFDPPSTLGSRSRAKAAIHNHEQNTIQLAPDAGSDREIHKTAYGDDWDVLWLGHCGADFPDGQSSVSPLRVEISGDETVPAPKHLKPHPFSLNDKLGELYPPHTRVVHASSGNVCTLAYAVSQRGARKLLSQFDNHYDTQWDLMLQKWCEGKYAVEGKSHQNVRANSDDETPPKRAESVPVCLTVQPPLFSHHYAESGTSNIQGQGGGYAKGTGTPYIRLSVQQNIDRLVAGAQESELVDQLPDNGDPIWG
ncbi:glycosyltransferase family 25 protein [Daldinia caldariorum]|uniref:glycosyltransferase family 25 protein n=1 Tax=Daldinia caldariorum TaxID=326644 RepID=UPI0020088878|nr:glycosyltransferase family 25 protein [Daldinia caldariorum]KAI1472464.1 glycosyltransferase family 25 protein [Daldinia caldariorum]